MTEPRRRANCAESRRIRGAACFIPTRPHTSSFLQPRSHCTSRASLTSRRPPKRLRPLAGDFAYLLFALGILGVGLIGVPVLAGSAAYALSETMGWDWGLELKAKDARGFYAVIAVSVVGALGIQYVSISPMKALFWSAVINGVVAVPLMAIIIILASRKSVMGPFTTSKPITVLGWIATTLMGAAALRMMVP
jgi:Mn2+/Fe2+ NRAMP family transporter